MSVDLPPNCIGRAKEKWRPLKRVAVAAGGRWPAVADELIARGLAEDDAEREAGLRTLPPGMVLLTDLRSVWPDHDELVPTRELVASLIAHNPDYWGPQSGYGKALTETRFGKLVAQASKVTSQRPGGRGSRGFFRFQFAPAWRRLRISKEPPGEPGALGYPSALGVKEQEPNQVHRLNQVHQVEPGATNPAYGTLFDDAPSRNGEVHKCGCGNTLSSPDAINSGKCKPCRDKLMAGYDQ